jgi:hypothetical protein
MTIGEMYSPLFKIETQDEFNIFFECCVKYSLDHYGNTRYRAESNESTNIEFFAMHCDSSVATKIDRFLGVALTEGYEAKSAG